MKVILKTIVVATLVVLAVMVVKNAWPREKNVNPPCFDDAGKWYVMG